MNNNCLSEQTQKNEFTQIILLLVELLLGKNIIQFK